MPEDALTPVRIQVIGMPGRLSTQLLLNYIDYLNYISNGTAPSVWRQ